MLSPDVLSLVKEYEQQGLLKENAGYLAREKEVKSEKQFDWEPWIERQEKTISDKVWYEKNLMNVVYVYENK
jgi:ABC-type lipoprotein release transport system permease subunit